MANIKNEPVYDPFPKTGLVKQYEPFIRAEVGRFCKQWPLIDYNRALFEPVKIAMEYEPKCDHKVAKDFSTPLRWHLRALKRILDEQNNGRLIHVDGIRQTLHDDFSAESNADVKNPEDAAEDIARKLDSDAAAVKI